MHHTATKRDTTTFNAIDNYHRKLGWGGCGYHYLITGDGTLWKGRAESKIGCHCRASGMNFKSIGICLTGNFEIEVPTNAQIATLQILLKRLRVKYNIPKEQVLGHREVPNAHTLCPGKNLLAWIRDYKKKKPIDREATKKRIIDLVNSL